MTETFRFREERHIRPAAMKASRNPDSYVGRLSLRCSQTFGPVANAITYTGRICSFPRPAVVS